MSWGLKQISSHVATNLTLNLPMGGRRFLEKIYKCRHLIECMARKQYRVEIDYPKKRKPRYFLVKDVRVRGKKRKIRKYLGVTPPTAEDVDNYRKRYAYDIELKAARKKAELSYELYTPSYLAQKEIKSIEEIRWIYKTFNDLLTTNEIKAYEQYFEINYIQGTTSIEGNTLSLKETYDLLIHGIPPKGKSLREINEIQNFRKVKEYRDKYKGKVTIDFIKSLHTLIIHNIDLESAGVFRRIDDLCILGCDSRVAPSILIEEELLKIIDEYYTKLNEGKYPFEEAVIFHYKFEMVHPFTDGNGRVGREIFNYLLTRSRYPKLLFLGKDRDTYIKALQFGNEEKYADMVQIFVNLIISQRLPILKTNLKKVVVPPKKTGQLRLTDFYL